MTYYFIIKLCGENWFLTSSFCILKTQKKFLPLSKAIVQSFYGIQAKLRYQSVYI